MQDPTRAGGASILPVILDRRSVRHFKHRPVEREKIDVMLEAARLAPSYINLQPFRVIVAEDLRDVLAIRRAAYGVGPAVSAPVVLVCLADTKAVRDLPTRIDELREAGAIAEPDFTHVRSGTGRPYHLKLDPERAVIDAAIAAEHMVLQAVGLGLGTCWVHNFEIEEVREHFDVPAHLRIVGLIAVGYPERVPARWPRIDSVEYRPKSPPTGPPAGDRGAEPTD